MIKLLAIFSTLYGCERWAEPENLPKGSFQEQMIHQESKTVYHRWPIGDVTAGEVLNFEIRGTEKGNQVSKVYTQQVERRLICSRLEDHLQCPPEYLTSQCTAYYRDDLGWGEYFLDLSQRFNWPFQILIGGQVQPLHEDATFQSPTLSATLIITEAMLVHGNDLALEVIPEPESKTEVGFLGFGPCHQVDKDDLEIGPPKRDHRGLLIGRRSKAIDLRPAREVYVTLTREKTRVEQIQIVWDKWRLTDLQAKDVLNLEITAYEELNQLSDIYSKAATAFWQSRICFNFSGNEAMDCGPWKTRINNCQALYRDYLGTTKTPLVLKDRDDWPFRLSIGGKKYSLDSSAHFAGTTLYAKITVTPELIRAGNDLVLEVIKPPLVESQVGFLDYDEKNCVGLGGHEFHTTADENHTMMTSSIKNRLEITVRRQSHDSKE